MNNVYSLDVIQCFCRMNGDALREKFFEFDCQIQFEFLSTIFLEHEASCVSLADSGDSTTCALAA